MMGGDPSPVGPWHMTMRAAKVDRVPVRVFASHPILKDHYIRLLAGEEDFHLVGDEDVFQVAVFDSALECLEAGLTLLRLRFPSMRPLLLSYPLDEKECFRWLFRGLWGLVPYDRHQEELPGAIRALAQGQLWFPAPVLGRWQAMSSRTRPFKPPVPLTKREREVMEFLVRRFSNPEIADILNISRQTVKIHVGSILEKLHVSSRQELSAEWALEGGKRSATSGLAPFRLET